MPSSSEISVNDASRNEKDLEATELNSTERTRILRKLDVHLLPFVSLLYLLSFLDRSNVGNARVAGMSTDLNLVGYRYNIAAAVFFILYSLAEVPSNIALKLFRPSRWIPTIMVAWGLVMTLMCLVNTFQGLVVARVFLGLTEAGLFPGVTYYISLWYPRVERSMRIAIFFSAATVAGAFGGILAYAIENMEGIAGLHGWQWIFCLEGIGKLLCATYHKVLIERERLLVPVYAIALFTPTIINELGYSAANAQLLSVPPFVCSCIFTILVGILSDKYGLRGPFVIGGAFVSLLGYLTLYTQKSANASYAGAVLAAIGVYPTIAVDLAWASSNAGGDVKRGVVLAMVIGLGNLGGICSSFIYLDPPRFHIGHGTIMGFLSLSILLSLFAMWDFNRINKRKEALCREQGITHAKKDEFVNMGDDSPLFRYTI
ncbi:hypothetical protein ID866_3834 [Astraeus odoratus]|nr:hypothetical protein ID866_3834 [Astraeus odoratus]